MSSTRLVTTGLLLLGIIAAGLWLAADRDAPLEQALKLPEARPLGAVALTDMHGRPMTAADLRGDWHLLFFGFANCPDICPITLQQLASARRQLASAGVEPLPRILFISVDPARDTPEVLADYAARFGDDVVAATGALDDLRELAGALGIYFEAAAGVGDDYEASHSAAVLALNPDAELAAVVPAPQATAALVHDLPILTGSR